MSLFFSVKIDPSCTHPTGCLNGVVAACQLREFDGAGSIPTWSSVKTNEEVVAKLLTQGSRPGETSSSQGWQGTLPALFHKSIADSENFSDPGSIKD